MDLRRKGPPVSAEGKFRLRVFEQQVLRRQELRLRYGRRFDGEGRERATIDRLLHWEFSEWVKAGIEVGYFDGEISFEFEPHDYSELNMNAAELSQGLTAWGLRTLDSYAQALQLALDDLTDERMAFLEAMWPESSQYDDFMAPLDSLVARLVQHPFEPVSADEVEAATPALLGSQSDLDPLGLPSDWRTAYGVTTWSQNIGQYRARESQLVQALNLRARNGVAWPYFIERSEA